MILAMDDVWFRECLGEPERNADIVLEEKLDGRSRRLTGEFLASFSPFVLSSQFAFLMVVFDCR